MVSSYLDGRIVGHVSRDSTAIEAREKAEGSDPEGETRQAQERL